MYTAEYIRHSLDFLKPAGTSRGSLNHKESYFIYLSDTEYPGIIGLGECSLIPGLSPDATENFESILAKRCRQITNGIVDPEKVYSELPSIRFAIETALLDLKSGGKRILFPSTFTKGHEGIPINGLIWMGNKTEMLKQVDVKLEQGFSILKLKVGAIDFADEIDIISKIRGQFGAAELELRLDANGAWNPKEAMEKLQVLSSYRIHSIEQPIRAGQIEEMSEICAQSPIPVALDEELIAVTDEEKKKTLLESIKPSYIILKPSLLGGLKASSEWIEMAEKRNIGWWITSALEANIGLNAIAQWTAGLNTTMPQGLGTGALYANNIQSPLTVVKDKLFYMPEKKWDLSRINKI